MVDAKVRERPSLFGTRDFINLHKHQALFLDVLNQLSRLAEQGRE